MADPKDVELETGKDWTVQWITLAINHPIDKVQCLNEEFIFSGEYPVQVYNDSQNRMETHWEWRIAYRVPLRQAQPRDDYSVLRVGLKWERGTEPRALRLSCATGDGVKIADDTAGTTRVTPPFPLGFKRISWDFQHRSPEALIDDAKQGRLHTQSAFSSLGKWHVAHAFTPDLDEFATIFLWHVEIPAFFEMHSHIESNHCSPLPPAWLHIWDGAIEWHAIQPGYDWQDKLAPLALGEGGKIGALPTSQVGTEFLKQMDQGAFRSIFPFLAKDADLIGCLMPMDMEYMHFNGYFGIPISQVVPTVNSATGESESVRWYCWDNIWNFSTNNRSVLYPDGTKSPPPYSTAPAPSKQGEVWCSMDTTDNLKYEYWELQRKAHAEQFGAPPGNSNALPLYHFDPRRYTKAAADLEETGWDLRRVLSQPVQSPTHTGLLAFFGFKLYTAMGWAPMDPFLRDPLETFYSHCQANQIPILNHCTPAGYYTHDRRHYFDLLQKHGKIAKGEEDLFDGIWRDKFAHTIPGPDGKPLTTKAAKDEHWWEFREEERIWWFIHHYVSPQAWEQVITHYPQLKICLAHLGDSDHFSDDAWGTRKTREPHQTIQGWFDPKKHLTIAFEGDKIDPARTHRFLYDLLNLVRSDNRVFVDLSYVILTEHNAAKFQELFDWARQHKPILLERILWGTDWPLIAAEKPVTSAQGGNMLHRYAKGFRDAVPDMPSDFFIRACFLNPLQYLDLRRIRALCQVKGTSAWEWVDDLDASFFNPDFGEDKAELFYKHHKPLVKKLTS